MIKADQITLDHLLIQQGALFTGPLMVPSLSSIEDVPDMENCIPINLAIKAGGVGYWGHCFVKDELQNKYWNKRKNPHSLIVCGHFFPWMQEKYPQVRMIRIKSYGQIWNERKKAMR